MNDIQKDRINRLLSRFGYRVLSSRHCKVFTEASNYPEISRESGDILIFDVGANIGQTSIAFRLEFPHARIVAFEPFSHIFDLLQRNTRKYNIECRKLALSNESIEKEVLIESLDPVWGYTNIGVTPTEHAKTGHIENITITTVDEFVHRHNIEHIDILKTDTEGFDLHVVQGAKDFISRKGIHSIISEVSISPDDTEHTQFHDMDHILKSSGYELYSFYDFSHIPENGRLNFFNALWKLPSSLDKT